MLHSLKVGQLARRIAERIRNQCSDPAVTEAVEALGGLDAETAEAAGLAHDLGHPPFGHVAEETLDRLVQPEEHDGFEGNAQSFRILTQLTTRPGPPTTPGSRIPGLNLTRATLRAVLKYPWHRQLNPANDKPMTDDGAQQGKEVKKAAKWGAYRSENAEYKNAMTLAVRSTDRDEYHRERSLEAEIMDWADDVTYAVHDLVDFHRAGLIPLEQLAVETDERWRFLEFAVSRLEKRTPDEAEGAFAGDVPAAVESVTVAAK